jgi:hypothetical protein
VDSLQQSVSRMSVKKFQSEQAPPPQGVLALSPSAAGVLQALSDRGWGHCQPPSAQDSLVGSAKGASGACHGHHCSPVLSVRLAQGTRLCKGLAQSSGVVATARRALLCADTGRHSVLTTPAPHTLSQSLTGVGAGPPSCQSQSQSHFQSVPSRLPPLPGQPAARPGGLPALSPVA